MKFGENSFCIHQEVSHVFVSCQIAPTAMCTVYADMWCVCYNTSRHVTCLVTAGGARVIQVGGGSRDLYYYPKDTVLVTAISPKLKKGTPVCNTSKGFCTTILTVFLSNSTCCWLSVLLYPCADVRGYRKPSLHLGSLEACLACVVTPSCRAGTPCWRMGTVSRSPAASSWQLRLSDTQPACTCLPV